MPLNLDHTIILPKMTSDTEASHLFQLIWNLDLRIRSSQHLISLLFRNVKTGFYLVDTIPPELLSYCTFGSFFKNGKKYNKKPEGSEWNFTIKSTANNKISDIKDVINDAEYDLSLSGSKYNSNFLNQMSTICKNQKCLVFKFNDTKIIIPCAVIAGTYYFKSSSLRNAVFSRKLAMLHGEHCFIESKKHLDIPLKPGAADSDANIIGRFLTNNFSLKRMHMIGNHLLVSKGDSQQLVADFPVEQDLTIKARGHLSTNVDGSKTFIVFQILEENSSFEFDSIKIIRNGYEKEDEDLNLESFPTQVPKTGNRIIADSPSSKYIRKILENDVVIKNQNDLAIKQTKETALEPQTQDHKIASLQPTDEDVQLSTQQELSTGGEGVAKGNVERNDGDVEEMAEGKDGYKMPLSDFLQMVRKLDGPGPGINDPSHVVTNFLVSKQAVWQRQKVGRIRTSLKEVYDHQSKRKRECLFVWFTYAGKHICLVEVDQYLLPNICSTYVLVSHGSVSKGIAEQVVKGYVLGKTITKIKIELNRAGIILENKKHPTDNTPKYQDAWRERLLQIILNGDGVRCFLNYVEQMRGNDGAEGKNKRF